MKLEIIDCSTDQIVSSYKVSELSMLDFQEWENGVTFLLDDLVNEVSNLSSPDPARGSIRFYLPEPIEDEALERLAQTEIDLQADRDEFRGMLEEIKSQAKMPLLDLRMILTVVVEEILRDYPQADIYRVRVSDG